MDRQIPTSKHDLTSAQIFTLNEMINKGVQLRRDEDRLWSKKTKDGRIVSMSSVIAKNMQRLGLIQVLTYREGKVIYEPTPFAKMLMKEY